MSDIADHVACLILHAVASRQDGKYAGFDDDVHQLLLEHYDLNIPRTLVDQALATLRKFSGATTLKSSVTGDMHLINSAAALYAASDDSGPTSDTSLEYDEMWQTRREEHPTILTYSYGGESWIRKVVERLSAEDGHLFFEGAPAADRIVQFDDNLKPKVEEAKQGLSDLAGEIRQTNDLPGFEAAERDVALAELADLTADLDKREVRRSAFAQKAKATLSWVAEKTAGSMIAEMAKALLKLLIAIVS